MRKGLLPLIFAASFSVFSCVTLPKEKLPERIHPPEQLMLLGFYEEGIRSVRDTDGDNKLDTIDYYKMVGVKNPNANPLDINNYFILKYERSEPFEGKCPIPTKE